MIVIKDIAKFVTVVKFNWGKEFQAYTKFTIYLGMKGKKYNHDVLFLTSVVGN